MNATVKIKLHERIRARDGDRCWLCDGKLQFDAIPNSKKAPTIEHLVALTDGGSNELANLVLTHPGCNRQLGCRPVEKKRQMREKRRKARERLQAVERVEARSSVAEGGPGHALPKLSSLSVPASDESLQLLRQALRRWQQATAMAAAAALLSFGFAAGTLLAS